MKHFHITYSIVTEDSVWRGYFAYNGFMTRAEQCPRRRNYIPKKPATFTLREAFRILGNHDSGREGVQADSSPLSVSNPPRWLSVSDSPGYMTGKGVTGLDLHIDKVTPSTAIRIARLAGCYGIQPLKPNVVLPL
jgi:hypothetical protein